MKAEPSTISTFRGITIDSTFENENADDSIRFNDDGDSNEIDESDLQYEKHCDPRISTEHGIKIDSSFEYENANDSIRFNDDDDSNEIDESVLEKEIRHGERISTEQGIQTFVMIESGSHVIVTIRTPLTTLIRRVQPSPFASDI
jgi:hypothetical protein